MSHGTVALLLDENVERRVAEYLRTEGFEAELVVDVLGAGAEDASDIVPYAREHDLIVVTKDVDFLRMDDAEHAGVFFLDGHRASAYAIAMAPPRRPVDRAEPRDATGRGRPRRLAVSGRCARPAAPPAPSTA